LSEDQFDDAYYNIKEKWQNEMYDIEGKSNNFFTMEAEYSADEG